MNTQEAINQFFDEYLDKATSETISPSFASKLRKYEITKEELREHQLFRPFKKAKIHLQAEAFFEKTQQVVFYK